MTKSSTSCNIQDVNAGFMLIRKEIILIFAPPFIASEATDLIKINSAMKLVSPNRYSIQNVPPNQKCIKSETPIKLIGISLKFVNGFSLPF